jgi:hypothetical protein
MYPLAPRTGRYPNQVKRGGSHRWEESDLKRSGPPVTACCFRSFSQIIIQI